MSDELHTVTVNDVRYYRADDVERWQRERTNVQDYLGELEEHLTAAEDALVKSEAKLLEARKLLGLVYADDTDWRTNSWFARVELVGGWPQP